MSCAVYLLHRVARGADRDRWGLTVEPEELRLLLGRLLDSGTLVPFPVALERLRNGDPAPSTVVTFDDAYEDLRDDAIPFAASRGAPITLFPATRYVEDRTPFWWEVLRSLEDRPDLLDGCARRWGWKTGPDPASTVDSWCAALKRLPPAERDAMLTDCAHRVEAPGAMSIEELRALPDVCAVGNHGHTHTVLSALAPEQLAEELSTSHALLERWTGRRPTAFAYPNGQPEDFDEVGAALLEGMGYSGALTTVPGGNRPGEDPFTLKRWSVLPGTVPALLESTLPPLLAGGAA